MLLLSPATADRDEALGWLDRGGGALDGVIAKRLADPYAPGKRAMVKVKQRRTADCVVGGFRYGSKSSAGRLAPARPVQRRRPARPRRLHLVDRREGPRRLDRGTRGADRPARLHRRRPRRTEPLGHRALGRVAAAAPRTGRRGALRPGHRRPLPPRHQAAPPPPRQGAAPVHDGAARPAADPGPAQAIGRLMLFDLALIPGLATRDEIVTAAEESRADRAYRRARPHPVQVPGFHGQAPHHQLRLGL